MAALWRPTGLRAPRRHGDRDRVVPQEGRPRHDLIRGPGWSRTVRTGLLLVAVLASALLALGSVSSASRVPTLWPAAGVMAGLFLITPGRHRGPLTGGCVALLVVSHLVQGYDWRLAVGFSLSSVAACLVVRRSLVAGGTRRRAALFDQGDVSRLVGSIASGSLVAALGCGLVCWATGTGNPLLGAMAAFGAHAAALMILLPLFLETLQFQPLAGTRERMVQLVLTVGTTVVVFAAADFPPVVFAVMPMFAWHAYRGRLRESTLLLTLVGIIGAGFTVLGIGPIYALGRIYDIPTEAVAGVLQLFLLDCGLIMLPLSVLVTQQRVATVRADAERETLQRLVASTHGTAIIATGPDGRIVLFNPGAEEMLGFTAEEALGELPDRFHPAAELRRQATNLRALPNFADICRASIESGDVNRVWRFRRRDGEERSMRMTLSAVPDERGELSGYLATAEDVTEREAAQQALLLTLQHQQVAVDRLKELERVKGDFVSTVSHELRTPITSIIGFTELLEDGMVGELSPEQLGVLNRVDRNGQRLLLLVEDLLTLSQIESARLKIVPVPTDLGAVLRAAYDAVADSWSTRELDVVLELPDVPVHHEGDPVQLQRMVVNLLTNAVKFTPDGGRVMLGMTSDGDVSQISVQDSGMGIPAAEQERLFTRFFRSSVATEQAIPGTGLGLTIVHSIVVLHGGQVDVSSVQGQGTTVRVTLPRVARVAAPEHREEARPITATA